MHFDRSQTAPAFKSMVEQLERRAAPELERRTAPELERRSRQIQSYSDSRQMSRLSESTFMQNVRLLNLLENKLAVDTKTVESPPNFSKLVSDVFKLLNDSKSLLAEDPVKILPVEHPKFKKETTQPSPRSNVGRKPIRTIINDLQKRITFLQNNQAEFNQLAERVAARKRQLAHSAGTRNLIRRNIESAPSKHDRLKNALANESHFLQVLQKRNEIYRDRQLKKETKLNAKEKKNVHCCNLGSVPRQPRSKNPCAPRKMVYHYFCCCSHQKNY
jgi:hypothetical protein